MFENWKIEKKDLDAKAEEYSKVSDWCNEIKTFSIFEDENFYFVDKSPAIVDDGTEPAEKGTEPAEEGTNNDEKGGQDD